MAKDAAVLQQAHDVALAVIEAQKERIVNLESALDVALTAVKVLRDEANASAEAAPELLQEPVEEHAPDYNARKKRGKPTGDAD